MKMEMEMKLSTKGKSQLDLVEPPDVRLHDPSLEGVVAVVEQGHQRVFDGQGGADEVLDPLINGVPPPRSAVVVAVLGEHLQLGQVPGNVRAELAQLGLLEQLARLQGQLRGKRWRQRFRTKQGHFYSA